MSYSSDGFGGDVQVVGVELCGDSTFQYFRQKGEVGDGPEVAHGVRLECRFLGWMG